MNGWNIVSSMETKKRQEKLVPLQISQHSPSGKTVFLDGQLVTGQEGGLQVD